ncbi:DUF6222 family protein [Amycolatopsis sp. OK19-0408]|uniref:DUF6222 family protein n=1 Tax=Amycolatopsis iheyensis TaxID=2945988 RepID=A0A9X2N917_9PSEU|nr:DUF6222 family protein [Amycolatopsis iheyensis]MCR6483522.1 DUF6222 family protein [Amycolatopsis iheyensis]
MIASGSESNIEATAGPARPVPPAAPVDDGVRTFPRLGRGVVWADVVAEIARDRQAGDVRTKDAA